MSEFSKSTNEDQDAESDSKTPSTPSSVRRIGSFAKSKAETPPARPSQIEIPALREILEGSKKAEDDSEKEKESEKTKEEKVTESAESEGTKKLNEKLKEQIALKQEKHQEVIDSTPPDSEEHAEAVAANEFEEKIKERIDGSEGADPVIESEYEHRLNELMDQEAEVTGMNTETDDPIELELTEGTESELTPDDDSTTTRSTVSLLATPPAPPSPPTGLAGNTPGRRATPPPVSPPPPVPPRRPFGGGGVPPAATPRAFNALPPTPNILNTPVETGNERSRRSGAFLVGGLLGYMIGRRGGRKRTEQRLQPEINTLKSNFEATKKHLEAREQDIKKAAAERRDKIEVEKGKVRLEKVGPKPVSEILRQTVTMPENRSTTTRVEPAKPAPEAAPQKQVEQLSTQQLLKTAESLFIEGTSVRKLYETNQIDRRGLVAIVQEGLQGGNIANVFEKVELGHERQAERAREFRHDDPSFSALSDDTASSAPLPDLNLQSATLPNTPNKDSLQPLNISSDADVPSSPSEAQSTPTPQNLKLSPKTAEFKFAAVAAIAIVALIIWAIIS